MLVGLVVPENIYFDTKIITLGGPEGEKCENLQLFSERSVYGNLGVDVMFFRSYVLNICHSKYLNTSVCLAACQANLLSVKNSLS